MGMHAVDKKSDAILLRLSPSEKQGFLMAADFAGLSLASWMRSRLRAKSARELETAGKPVPFRKAS